MTDWKEALEQLVYTSESPGKEAATIRAHIEGLEAEVAKLRAWAHRPDGVQWHIQQREAAEARVRELEAHAAEHGKTIAELVFERKPTMRN